MKIIKPNWPAPDNVTAFTTTRMGGYSQGVFQGLNLAAHVGDELALVSRNRNLLMDELPAQASIQWLSQVHGKKVVLADSSRSEPEADASWTSATKIACAVITADCLPVLFCTTNGGKIAVAHAGWRGLNSGVLEATVEAMGIDPSQLMAWLGPAIGATAFEVGAEVRAQFLSASPAPQRAEISQCFIDSTTRGGFYLADLYRLARIKLEAIGLAGIYGGGLCTFSDQNLFYSYRRDGQTGRMATLIVKTSSPMLE